MEEEYADMCSKLRDTQTPEVGACLACVRDSKVALGIVKEDVKSEKMMVTICVGHVGHANDSKF